MDLEEVMGLQELEKRKDKFKIMITYLGGIAGQSVIKMIKKSKYKDRIEIIGTDCDKYAAGFEWVDKPYLVSKVPECLSQYDQIIRKEKPDLILPTGEEDLTNLSKY